MFEWLSVWKREEYRKLQGTNPVVRLSFANVNVNSYEMTRQIICQTIVNLYSGYEFLLKGDKLSTSDKEYVGRVTVRMNDVDASLSLLQLSKFLYQYYGKK